MASTHRRSRNVHTDRYDAFDRHELTVIAPGTSRAVRIALASRTCGMVITPYAAIAAIAGVAAAAAGASSGIAWWAAAIGYAAAVGVRHAVIAAAGGRNQLVRSYETIGSSVDVIDTTRVPYEARKAISEIAAHHRSIITAANGPAGSRIDDDMLAVIDHAIWDAAGHVDEIDRVARELAAITGHNAAAAARRDRRSATLDAELARVHVYRDEIAAIATAAIDADAEYRNLAELGLLELVVTCDVDALDRHDELVAAAEALHAAAEAARDVHALDTATPDAIAAVVAATSTAS